MTKKDSLCDLALRRAATTPVISVSNVGKGLTR
jgi:hypothetical protein